MKGCGVAWKNLSEAKKNINSFVQMKGCGVAWKNLSEVKKAEYKSKHEKSKEPYLKELNKWESAIDKDGR